MGFTGKGNNRSIPQSDTSST